MYTQRKRHGGQYLVHTEKDNKCKNINKKNIDQVMAHWEQLIEN